MNLNLGNEGLKLLKKYQETLQISFDEASLIILKNKTAQALLKEEPTLKVTGPNKNLSALLRITLLRNPYDFNPITKEEKKLVKKYYFLDIK